MMDWALEKGTFESCRVSGAHLPKSDFEDQFSGSVPRAYYKLARLQTT